MDSRRRMAKPFVPVVLATLAVAIGCNRAAESTSCPSAVDGSDLQGALRHAIAAGGNYLVDACGPDGQFVYRVHLDPGQKATPRYNILRHAGAICALGMIDRYRPDPAVRNAMLRSAKWMKHTTLRPVPNEADLQAIWSFPEINGSGEPTTAKLGGTGLGLVALMSVERISPGATSLEQLRGLGRFLVFMQRDDGSFYSKYTPEHGGRDDRWESLYYPGEAALGLLMLDECDPSPAWREAAIKTLLYLARSRRDMILVEADHWSLLATARLFAQTRETLSTDEREAVLHHAEQVCRSILARRPPAWTTSAETQGSLTPDARTCPTATRLEGLIAALTFLPDEQASLRREIRSAVDDGIAFLHRSQIRSGPYCGGMPRASLSPKPDGGWHFADTRSGEIRIDYVQHAVSAMIQYDGIIQAAEDTLCANLP